MSLLYKNLKTHVEDLQEDFPGLTDFEALQIAVNRERTEVLRRAFVVTHDDSTPTAFEALALALGFSTTNPETIRTAIQNIADAMNDK